MQRTYSIRRTRRERRVGSLPPSWLIPVARTNMSDSSNVRSSSRERNVFEGKWQFNQSNFQDERDPASRRASSKNRNEILFAGFGRGESGLYRDRKSTRLNSSH